MDVTRRRCTGGLLAAGMLAAVPRASANGTATPIASRRRRGSMNVDIRQHGGRGDGRADDTDALQKAIDALPADGGTVIVPAGFYLIDPLRSVRLRDRMQLQLADDAWLVAKPNAAPRAYVLTVQDVEEVEIVGGHIRGERDHHRGTAGEWGHGIMIRGSNAITVQGMRIVRCWGDGISVGGISGVRPRPSRDVVISDVICAENRRQGLTIGRSRGVRVLRSQFIDTAGTLPGCGIDVEPDPGDIAEDVLIERCLARGNHGAGIQLYDRCRKVIVRGCRVLANRGDGILVRSASDCVIEDNEIRDNGLRGVAIRGGSEGLRLSRNQFTGNARAVAQRTGGEKGWLHVDVARSARGIQVDRSNQLGP